MSEDLSNSPLFQVSGMFEIGEPGWADKHDEYIAESIMGEHAMRRQAVFEELPPQCVGTCNTTTFRFQGHIYTIVTTNITRLHAFQLRYDQMAGYTGILGNYETMLFVDDDSLIYPFGDLPGNPHLGVFVRYETEEEARDGHQTFVTQVKQQLMLEDEEEREWDAIVSSPKGQATLKRLGEETRRAIEAREIERLSH